MTEEANKRACGQQSGCVWQLKQCTGRSTERETFWILINEDGLMGLWSAGSGGMQAGKAMHSYRDRTGEAAEGGQVAR